MTPCFPQFAASDAVPQGTWPWVCTVSLGWQRFYGAFFFSSLISLWSSLPLRLLHPAVRIHELLADYFWQYSGASIAVQPDQLNAGLFAGIILDVSVWGLFWPQEGSSWLSLSLWSLLKFWLLLTWSYWPLVSTDDQDLLVLFLTVCLHLSFPYSVIHKFSTFGKSVRAFCPYS